MAEPDDLPAADQRELLTAVVALAACWMMLLGPATESCTYILLAPTLAWAVLESWLVPRSWVPERRASRMRRGVVGPILWVARPVPALT